MKQKTKQAARRRQAESLVRPLLESLDRIESEINQIRSRMKKCKCCGAPCFETRSGAKQFCCDLCRTEWNNEQRGKGGTL